MRAASGHCQGADQVANLIQQVQVARQTWYCASRFCPATRAVALSFCVCCRLVLCAECGGPISEWAPIEAFICQHCQLQALAGLRQESAEPLSQLQQSELRQLIRGTTHVLNTAKRGSTGRSYRTGRGSLEAFTAAFQLPTFPVSPQTLGLMCTHAVAVRKLDTSTVKQRMLAVGDFYDYVSHRLHLRGVRNPLRDPELISLLRVYGLNFKKAAGGSMALTLAELHGLFERGLTTLTRRGRWARLYCIFLNFGMLRNTAVKALTIVYEISRDGLTVTYLPGSNVRIEWNEAFGADCIIVDVDSDKNMNAQKAARDGGRHAFIPATLEHLGVTPAEDLNNYILRERPPSGGPLFAYPNKTGNGFARKPCSTFNTYLRDAYKRAFPQVTPEHLKKLGTHSGRKTLSQALWDHGFSRRLIADAAGWFLKKEAMDIYFRTSALMILRALSTLRVGGLTHLPFVTIGD
jgi:hypothetical protein